MTLYVLPENDQFSAIMVKGKSKMQKSWGHWSSISVNESLETVMCDFFIYAVCIHIQHTLSNVINKCIHKQRSKWHKQIVTILFINKMERTEA